MQLFLSERTFVYDSWVTEGSPVIPSRLVCGMEDDVELRCQNEVFPNIGMIEDIVLCENEICPDIGREEIVLVKCEPDWDELLIKKRRIQEQPRGWNVRSRLTKEEYLKRQRELYHRKRADLSDEQKKIKRSIRNDYLAQKLLLETEEQRQERLLKRRFRNSQKGKGNSYNKYYYQMLKGRMTDEKRQKIRDYYNKRRQRLKLENPEEYHRKNKNHYRKYWINIPAEKREAELQRRRDRYNNMTNEQREQKKAYERLRSAKIRSGEWEVKRMPNHPKKRYICDNEYNVETSPKAITKCIFKYGPYTIRNANNLHVIDGKEPILKLEKLLNFNIDHEPNTTSNLSNIEHENEYTSENATNYLDNNDDTKDLTSFNSFTRNDYECRIKNLIYQNNTCKSSNDLNNLNIENLNIMQMQQRESVIKYTANYTSCDVNTRNSIPKINSDLKNKNHEIPIKHNGDFDVVVKLSKTENTQIVPITKNVDQLILSCGKVLDSIRNDNFPNELHDLNDPHITVTEKLIRQSHVDHTYAKFTNTQFKKKYEVLLNSESNNKESNHTKWKSKSKEYMFGKVPSYKCRDDKIMDISNNNLNRNEKLSMEKKQSQPNPPKISVSNVKKFSKPDIKRENSQNVCLVKDTNISIDNVQNNPLYSILEKMTCGNTIHEAIAVLSRDRLRRILNLFGCNYTKGILKLERYTLKMVKFEIDINCLIKTIINWAEQKNIKNVNMSNINEVYKDIYSHLSHFKHTNRRRDSFIIKKLEKYHTSQEVVMIVTCSLKEFQKVFHNKPQKNTTKKNNYDSPRAKDLWLSSFPENIFYWPYISTQINLPNFSLIHLNTQTNEFHLINNMNNSSSALYQRQSTDLFFEKTNSRREFLPEFIIKFLNQLKIVIDVGSVGEKITTKRKIELISIITEFEKFIATFSNTIHTNTKYHMNLSPYPYIRYLGTSENEIAVSTNAMLQQVFHPKISFLLDKFNVSYEVKDGDVNFIFDNQFLDVISTCVHYKCVLCSENLGSYFPSTKVKEHLEKFHGIEADSKCVICSKTFSTKYLSMNRWKHDCDVTNVG